LRGGSAVSSSERFHFPSQGDFWSQATVIAFAAAAVVAIVLVNAWPQPAAGTGGRHGEAPSAPAPCSDCGEMAAVRTALGAPAGTPGGVGAGVPLAQRAGDGRARTSSGLAPAAVPQPTPAH
jgi:hypothetical protein